MPDPKNPTGKSDANGDPRADGQPQANGGGGGGTPAVPGKAAGPSAPRTLSLVKGPHRFSFNYEVGEEPAVLDALVDMVHRRELPFDWFDAAVLSHQLGQHLAKELMGYLPKKAA